MFKLSNHWTKEQTHHPHTTALTSKPHCGRARLNILIFLLLYLVWLKSFCFYDAQEYCYIRNKTLCYAGIGKWGSAINLFLFILTFTFAERATEHSWTLNVILGMFLRPRNHNPLCDSCSRGSDKCTSTSSHHIFVSYNSTSHYVLYIYFFLWWFNLPDMSSHAWLN